MPSMGKVRVSFGLAKSAARAMKNLYCNVPTKYLMTCFAIIAVMLVYCAQVKCHPQLPCPYLPTLPPPNHCRVCVHHHIATGISKILLDLPT